MPFYEFKYTNDAGEEKVVEKLFSMRNMPHYIEVVDPDGKKYRADRVEIPMTARMAYSWNKDVIEYDLPPENYVFPEDRAHD